MVGVLAEQPANARMCILSKRVFPAAASNLAKNRTQSGYGPLGEPVSCRPANIARGVCPVLPVLFAQRGLPAEL